MPWWSWVAIGFVLLLIGSGAFLWTEQRMIVELAGASLSQDSLLNTSTVKVSFSLPGYRPGRGTPTVLVDGSPAAASAVALRPDGVDTSLSLADGSHTIAIDYTSANIFCRHLADSVRFVIDSVAPTIEITSPEFPQTLGTMPLHLAALLSEPASLALTLDGTPVALAPSALQPTSVAVDVDVPEGWHDFLLVATDAAGNSSSASLRTWADLKAPVITAESWPQDKWKKSSQSLAFGVEDSFPDRLIVRAKLDGKGVDLAAVASAALPPAGSAAGSDTKAGALAAPPPDSAGQVEASGRGYSFATGELTEGLHEVVVDAVDGAGHSATWKRSFLVDTTETFGAKPMGPGAVGKDVSKLQSLLAAKGFYEAKATGIYDEPTLAAVTAYRAAHGLAESTVIDAKIMKMLLGAIRIDLSECKLYLWVDGKPAKTYPVAVGMPAYPTPTGSYKIITKEVDPTWDPPDSPWAAGAEPIPPGPGNPLGTRWMGLSAPSVGIHGTPDSGSIGTYASHGCIRMYISDAEDLFRRIYIGTPVDIVR